MAKRKFKTVDELDTTAHHKAMRAHAWERKVSAARDGRYERAWTIPDKRRVDNRKACRSFDWRQA